MSKTKAIIVGVSNYMHSGANTLPFCQNDIMAIKDAFVHGLNVQPEDIIVCGENGSVLLGDFVRALQYFSSNAAEDEILLFYFSGHGMNSNGDHFLVLTDSFVNTQEVITYLEAIPSKSKVLFLDCCHAGNFEVNGSAALDIDATVDNFAGKGYAVFASSSAVQVSQKHPDKEISLFTSFLCDALLNRFTIREGKKSLYDIQKLLLLMLKIWNKGNPSKMQTPIYRANLGGTVYFDVEDYHPYVTGRFFQDSATYTIYSVEPTHNGIAKRYSVKVILKVPMVFSDIAAINHEIVDRVKNLNIYGGPRQEMLWKNKPANLVFCYFGLSETDLVNNNYICHTTWADETQDKKWWYKTGNNFETIDDINFSINPYYDFMKQFTAEHTASRAKLVAETKEIIHRMISLAEQIISIYNEFLNNEESEAELINKISRIAPEINELYFRETDLDIPPDDIAKWCNQCSAIAGCIHDLTLYYSNKVFLTRTPKNRRACMDMSIRQYYKDLEQLKTLEQSI